MSRKLNNGSWAEEVMSADAMLVPVGSHTGGTDISSAVTLTKPATAIGILIQALTQNVRFTLDGTAPTTTLGFRITAGDAPIYIPVPSASIKVIEEAATASLQYQWVG